MLERQSPMTVLLGAIALWVAGLLVLALAGLGGRVDVHPTNAALAPPLPEVPAMTDSGSELRKDAVSVVAARPLFLPTRRPAPIAAVAGTGLENRFAGSLTSVLMAGEVQLAIFALDGDKQPLRVRLGESVPGTSMRLSALEPRRATLDGPEGQQVLELRVFDGQGGAAPTASTVTRVASADAAPTSSAAPATPGAAPPTADEQAQIDAIRQRIAARRAQLQEQQAGTAPNKPDEETP